MTTLSTHPLEPDLLDELALVADTQTPLGQDHYGLFLAACRAVADELGYVDPNLVRAHLTVNGELQIDVRAYSAMWSRACGKDGPMSKTSLRVQISGPGSRGNGNKSVCVRRFKAVAS